MRDEILKKVLTGANTELKNDQKFLKEIEETLANDIQTEIKKIIAEETCAYL